MKHAYTLTPAQARLLAQMADGHILHCRALRYRGKFIWTLHKGQFVQSVNSIPPRHLLKRELIHTPGASIAQGLAEFHAQPEVTEGRHARLAQEPPCCPYDAALEPGRVIRWHTGYMLPTGDDRAQE